MKNLKMELAYDLAARSIRPGVGLPSEMIEFYGSDLVLAEARDDRAMVSTNFVVRRDGMVNVPEAPGGLTISGGCAEDFGLMAVLRASHDGVLVGSETLAAEGKHLWTARFIYPDFAEILEKWREEKKGHKNPYNIILTRSGEVRSKEDPNKKVPLSFDYPVFNHPDIRSVVVTTHTGMDRIRRGLMSHDNIQPIIVPAENFEIEVLEALKHQLQIDNLLVEGGPTVNMAFHKVGLVSDDFLTLAPGVVGRAPGSHRKGLTDGDEYDWDKIPLPVTTSLRYLIGRHQFVRDTYEQADEITRRLAA